MTGTRESANLFIPNNFADYVNGHPDLNPHTADTRQVDGENGVTETCHDVSRSIDCPLPTTHRTGRAGTGGQRYLLLMPIYTKTGDKGDTGFFGGGRVGKDNIRVTAYGEIDELNAVIGGAMACEPRDFEASLLESIQRDLFSIGAQLATPDPDKVARAIQRADLPEGRVRELEAVIDTADRELEPLKAFVLPGGTPKATMLHQARTVCRRAERHVVALAHGHKVPPVVLVYLNRLADVLFTLARLANHRAGAGDRIW